MSIDAVIERVTRNANGTATLHLGPRDGEGPGQSRLTVLNPPPSLEAAVGTEIWGGGESIIVGRETKWADRIGYTKIRLCKPTK